MISAAVRLGHKYQMSKLLDHAIAHLKKHYTNDYDTWYDNEDYVPCGFASREHAIGVVNLARLTGETSLLPTALLGCCMLSEDVLDGFARADGSLEHLSMADVGLCMAGRERLVKESVTVAFRVFQPVASDKCKTKPTCLEGFRRMHANLEQHIFEITIPDPCGAFHDKFTAGDLCTHCKTMVQERDVRERKAVWAKLPEIFGVKLPDVLANAGASA